MRAKLSGEHQFLRRMFSAYYARSLIPPPKLIERREFGFILFGREGMVRHLSFRSGDELNDFLRREAPLHAYFSSAYYEVPNAEDMDSKGWLGADLVFDIDADHIPTPCKEEHDRWTCLDCGYSSSGMAPEACPQCKSKRLKAETWLCELCLEVAKSETIKLVEDFLVADLGLSTSEMSFNFSGHRGYHVHVHSDVVRELSQEARREITDYIRGVGIMPKLHGFSRASLSGGPPDLADPGWRGRLARGLYDFISRASIEDVRKVIRRSRVARVIVEHRDEILRSLESTPPRWPSIKGVSVLTWSRIASHVARAQGSFIDERVTTDIKRLMRLPETIHGKTGFKVKKLSFSELESFDPLVDAVVFRRGEVEVHVDRAPSFAVGGEAFGPFEDATVTLPMPAAIYLLCKGAATLPRGEG